MARERLTAVGYEALVRGFDLEVRPHFRKSLVGARARHSDMLGDQERHIYPTRYAPKAVFPVGDIEFALKHEGVSLEILKAVFERWPPSEIVRYVSTTPTGQYTRRIWFLYEWLTHERLDLPDARAGNYVAVLDQESYYTATPSPSPRHRVHDNLPGTPAFCPLVRRTERLREFAKRDFAEAAQTALAEAPPGVLDRATEYLYLKETRSSYAIERETPDQSRAARFVELLQRAPAIVAIDKETLIELQNAIVDPRFSNDDYRTDQNYVGETRPDLSQRVHFVSPTPTALDSLMPGLLACDRRLTETKFDPVVHAAIIAFGFVFLHPFDDGNGRIHRFLIHYVLSKAGLTPAGLILPVSATMLADRPGYDTALASISRPLMELVDYELDDDGRLTVRRDTGDLYRYLDLTEIAEYLYDVVATTVDCGLVEEIRFIVKHDRAKAEMQEIVDLPARELNLFFKLAVQNNGRLARRKRKAFEMLDDGEIEALEDVIQRVMFLAASDPNDGGVDG